MLIKQIKMAAAGREIIGDVYITDGVIQAVGESLDIEDRRVIDGTGLILLPGGVDAHTHMDLDVGVARATDDFYTGTVAAAFGGTTTIIDHMAFAPSGKPLMYQVEQYHGLARDKAVIDYGFHGVIQRVDEGILNEMAVLMEEGITSSKIYLTYDGKLNDEEAFRVLRRAGEIGMVIAVHPENDGVVNFLRRDYKEKGCLSPEYHPKSRPVECEAEAVYRMLMLSRMAGDAPLYIVHLTNEPGLSSIKDARRRGQKNIFAETCPQYLFLDEALYRLPKAEGLKYIMSPPLRSKEHREALWRGVEDGAVDVIATDHCPFFYEKEKQLGKEDFTLTPNGAPGVEARLPLLFSEGYVKGRISLARLAELCCENPAKIFGLYPKKGCIAPGSDADLVLFDPKLKVRLTKTILHENTDYTPYEGMELTGYPVMTISRGEIIVDKGRFLGGKGRGRFLKRDKSTTRRCFVEY